MTIDDLLLQLLVKYSVTLLSISSIRLVEIRQLYNQTMTIYLVTITNFDSHSKERY